MILLRTFKNIFKVEDLRNKILYTFAVLAVYRFGTQVPLPGIDAVALQKAASSMFSGGFLSYINLMSGGALSQGAIFALGIMPYISASIMMQILGFAIPSLEALSKEGESGRRVINQYTRYLTIGLSLMQGAGLAAGLEKAFGAGVVISPGWGFRLTSILILTVGALFVMWMGEQIGRYGIGQGASLIIFANIVTRLPESVLKLAHNIHMGQMDPLVGVAISLFALTLVGVIVFLERGERRIPVQYARRVVGKKVFGGMNTYIPLKLNPVGVMPVILTTPMIGMIGMVLSNIAHFTGNAGALTDWMSRDSFSMILLQVVLIIFFSFVYTGIQYNPEELAENIRKSSGFIPGIRPGKKTAEFFNFVLMRLGASGSIYLAALAVIPGLALSAMSSPIPLSGLSLLIAVGVAMDTSSQIESALVERKYEGFLSSGSLKGRRG